MENMVTPGQISKTIQQISDSGIDAERYQKEILSGAFTKLLQQAVKKDMILRHVILPIRLPKITSQMARAATQCVMEASPELKNAFGNHSFCFDVWDHEEREFVLVNFGQFVKDDKNPKKSELLSQLKKLQLKPEGFVELSVIIKHGAFHQVTYIVARGTVVNPDEGGDCVAMENHRGKSHMKFFDIDGGWDHYDWILASRR